MVGGLHPPAQSANHVRLLKKRLRIAEALTAARDKEYAARLARLRHDLLNPIHTILGFLELLEADLVGRPNPMQSTCIENLRLAAKRLEGIVSSLPGGASSGYLVGERE